MAKELEIDFPKYMNDYRLFVYFPIDLIAVAFTGFSISFWLLSLYFGILLSLLFAIGLGIYSFVTYREYKKDAAPGVLFHLMYVMGFFLLDPPMDDEEFNDLDVDSFFPAGYETEFQD